MDNMSRPSGTMETTHMFQALRNLVRRRSTDIPENELRVPEHEYLQNPARFEAHIQRGRTVVLVDAHDEVRTILGVDASLVPSKVHARTIVKVEAGGPVNRRAWLD